MAFVGEAFLSAFIGTLFDKLASSELLKFARQEQVHAEIKKWERMLLKIYAVLEDAEEKQMTNRLVKMWLDELKDLAYDAEDILDEFATEALRRNLMGIPLPSTSKVWSFIPSCCTSFSASAVKFNFRMVSKIETITARLQDISTQKSDLVLRENAGGSSQQIRDRLPTTSLVVESHVYGRETDKEAILDMLLKDESTDNEVCIISIVGMGGLGKTTLAQLAYNDDKVKDHFDLRVWVCVSDDFDVLRIAKIILQSVASHTNHDADDLNLLQVDLKEKLSGKKFLLILDDVWSERSDKWDSLCSPLRAGASGSKIVVTTRNMGVVSAITGTCSTYTLAELSFDDCLSLFTQQALGRRNFDDHPNLKAIGEEIVKKCKGLPLAAKTLGGLLRTKIDLHAWREISRSKIWDLPEERSGILPALKLSYHHLPSHLKRCFAYCSIFPKDYEFDKDDLILLWMAEGFLQHAKGVKQQEDLGSEYFYDLISRSFFQQSSQSSSRFLMHDLISDLSQFVAGETCFNLEDKLGNEKQTTIYEKARHSSFIRQYYNRIENLGSFLELKSLRTLLALPVHAFSNRGNLISTKMVQDLLTTMRCLRVLSLSGYSITKLPNSIGDCRSLRYLNLSCSSIIILPESVGHLYNLQALILHNCVQLIKLPEEIGNLINLRHLDLTNTLELKVMPPQIGNLINLQTLSKFIVGKDERSGIQELKHLSDLQGKVYISGLHNVVNIRDAMDANLKDKHNIEELIMEWSNNFGDSGIERNEMPVLELLQPHRNLKKLTVAFYGGTKFPSWMGDPSFSTMVSLTLKDCRMCTSLPSLGQLSSLKVLCIEGMSEIKTVGSEFYGKVSLSVKPFLSLVSLVFGDMAEWEEWSFSTVVEDVELFPRLQELTLRNCPKLIKKLPNCLPSLLKLNIFECQKLADPLQRLPCLHELHLTECNQVVLRNVADLTSLSALDIRSISGLTCLKHGFTPFLAALENLVICDCDELTSLWENGLGAESLCHLQDLKIQGCPALVSLEEQCLPCSLEYLKIEGCDNLEKLPNGLQNLTRLEKMRIEKCPKLESFPEMGLPPMLRSLVIENCKGLKSLPCDNNTYSHLIELQIKNCNGLDSLPEGIMHYNSISTNNTCHLEVLNIQGCSSLKSFPSGKLPSTLKQLEISDGMELESISERMVDNNMLECLSIDSDPYLKILPECLHNLTYLCICNCPGLESFPERGLPLPNLKTLLIGFCENLKCLPNQMQNLQSLESLCIFFCPGLVFFPEGGLAPNLKYLKIDNCENLKAPLSEWGFHRLTFLSSLVIWSVLPEMVSLSDDECFLPTSLTDLDIYELESLASLALQNLDSLKRLYIARCPKLWSLRLPPMLASLNIRECPILKERCLKDKGEHWPNIADIPQLTIDQERIH